MSFVKTQVTSTHTIIEKKNGLMTGSNKGKYLQTFQTIVYNILDHVTQIYRTGQKIVFLFLIIVWYTIQIELEINHFYHYFGKLSHFSIGNLPSSIPNFVGNPRSQPIARLTTGSNQSIFPTVLNKGSNWVPVESGGSLVGLAAQSTCALEVHLLRVRFMTSRWYYLSG